MSKWIYPDKETLKWWGEYLEDPTIFLHEYLPLIDGEWVNTVSNTLELLKFDHYNDEIHHKAAHVLYKVCKNHHFIDGNKRSSIIVLYLFCIVNGYMITCSPEEIKKLAKQTADINGSQNYESDIKNIQKILEGVIVPISKN